MSEETGEERSLTKLQTLLEPKKVVSLIEGLSFNTSVPNRIDSHSLVSGKYKRMTGSARIFVNIFVVVR